VHINLDLSVLIAFISDLTHSPLPKTAEASTRFIPPRAYRKKKTTIVAESVESEGIDVDAGEIPSDLAKHFSALANQLLQEMGKGLLQEIYHKISLLTPVTGGDMAKVIMDND
jgi:hypothetical protein